MENSMGLPILGAPLPEMKATTTHGEMTLPNNLKGKWFVLFSHPSDFTPVCTTEFVGLAAAHEEFKAINTELVGLSVDSVVSHLKWTEWIKEHMGQEITFPIIADSLGRVANKLGMIHEAKGTDTVRAVFIVDDKGILRTMMYYPQEAGRSVPEIIRTVKALQYADKHGTAMPENWPNNDILGSDVLIEPAKTEELAQERRETMKDNKDVEYRDWWFISKPMEK